MNRRQLSLLVLALLALCGTLLAAACGGGEDSSPLIQAETTQLDQKDSAADKLYLAGRDEFRICVDGTEGASATTAQMDTVRRALDLALPRAVQIASDRLSEIPSQYAAPVFVRGCPDADVLAAALAGEQLDRRERNSMVRDKIIGDLGPSAPNPHRAFVYFVDSDTYTAAFGADRYISTSEEFICEGICGAVTRALYVPSGAQNEVIQDGLLEVLNLLSGQQIRDLWQDRLNGPTAATATPQPPAPTANLGCPKRMNNHLNIDKLRLQPGMTGAVITEIDDREIRIVLQGVEFDITGRGTLVIFGGRGDPSDELFEQVAGAIDAVRYQC